MERISLEKLSTTLRETMNACIESLDGIETIVFSETIDNVGRNITLGLSKDIDLDRYGIDLSRLVNNCGQFGSTSSRDIDLFVVLDELPSTKLVKSISAYLTLWVEGMVEVRGLDYDKVDIQFIMLDNGVVSWSSLGNEPEVNNAIYYTYSNHLLNNNSVTGTLRECPVKEPVPLEMGIKLIKCVRSLITFLSRTKYREELLPLLYGDSMIERCRVLYDFMEGNDGLLSEVGTLNKPNLPDEDIYKSIAFSFIQLNQIIDNEPVTYTKEDIIYSESYAILAPLILQYESKYMPLDSALVGLDCLISDTLHMVFNGLLTEENGVIYCRGDKHGYYVKSEKATQRIEE